MRGDHERDSRAAVGARELDGTCREDVPQRTDLGQATPPPIRPLPLKSPRLSEFGPDRGLYAAGRMPESRENLRAGEGFLDPAGARSTFRRSANCSRPTGDRRQLMPTIIDKGILGLKLGMTRVFLEDGSAVACTLVEAGPCKVVQRKTLARDGYDAIQLGFGEKREKLVNKPMKGHYKKAGVDALRHIREIRLMKDADGAPEVGSNITCDIFSEGEFVDVIGTMKGRGYTGVVKRHGFATLKESHGAHFFVRHAGSIGSRKPQHTLRGTRMSGQYGNSRITVQNLEILRIDAEKNLLYIKGAIPGAPKGLVQIRAAKKK